jgi:hypothetical protein
MGVVLVDASGTPLHQVFEAYPENRDAESLFYICSTQWERNAMTGQLLSLHYPGVEAAARMAGITITPDLFYDLRLIEHGAIGAVPEFPELKGLDLVHIGFTEHGE